MIRLFTAAALLLFLLLRLPAEDWPGFHGNPDRTGFSREALPPPLYLSWTFQAAHPPSPAFRGLLSDPKSKAFIRSEAITYDYAFHPVIANGLLYFSSSTEEAVFCLNARTGRQEWVFYAEGPVRFAPVVNKGRIYFGSDDGCVYCLKAASGELLWKYQAAPENQCCIGNQHLISQWPVRTGVTLVEGILYFAAGVLPPQGVFLHAVEAESGSTVWKKQIPYSPNGQILVSGNSLWMPTGRTAPAEFDRHDGTSKVAEPGLRRAQGGSFISHFDGMLVYGPCESGMLHLRVGSEPDSATSRKAGAETPGLIALLKGRCLLAGEQSVYLVREDKIWSFDKSRFLAITKRYAAEALRQAKFRPPSFAAAGLLLKEYGPLFEELKTAASWSIANTHEIAWAILAEGTLYAGGKNVIVAIDTRTGEQSWTGHVRGQALGLAVAEGALFVSTDSGHIYCFHVGRVETPLVHSLSVSNPFPENPVLAEAAECAIRSARRSQGWCLVIGAGNGQWAAEIANRSEFHVVACDNDPVRVHTARRNLAAAGLYGKRVVVHHVSEKVAYPDFFANLLVSENPRSAGAQLSRLTSLVQPCGGTVFLGPAEEPFSLPPGLGEEFTAWQSITGRSGVVCHVAQRGRLPDAGEWSHCYADPANTVCSQERRLGRDFAIQWFGPPGAADVVDRHDIAHAPLVKGGKIFQAGLNHTLSALDAYNGTVLWKIQTAGSTRKIISHQAPFMAAAENTVFIASGRECWMLDPLTGRTLHAFPGINPESDWGYVGTMGNFLIGSNQKPDMSQRAVSSIREFTLANAYLSKPSVSEILFVYDHSTSRRLWCYAGGVILNPTIAVGGDRIFFVESRNQTLMQNRTGLAPMTDFVAREASVVALDLATGRECWRKPLLPKTTEPQWIMYLGYSSDILLSTRVYWVKDHFSYDLTAMDATTGADRWSDLVTSPVTGPYAPLVNGKNAQATRPCIVNGKVYWLAHTFGTVFCHDLFTGQPSHDPQFGRSWENKGCAPFVSSATALFHRATSCEMYDLASRAKYDLTRVTRPSCWMSIIPAAGLVLMLDGSAGCTCGLALQMSVALAPKRGS